MPPSAALAARARLEPTLIRDYMPLVADRSYTDDEVEAIFRRAIERQQSQADGLGHEELIAAAREMGLDDTAIDRAVREVEHDRVAIEVEREVRQRKRRGWVRHLMSYLVIVGSMVGLHFLGVAGPWVWWVVFGWGAGLLLSTPGAFRAPNERELERAHAKRNRRERRKAEAEARRRRDEMRRMAQIERERARLEAAKQGRSPVESEIEHVIEEGVSLLLRLAATKIREAAEPQPPKGDFGRYVAKKKGQQPAPPRVETAAPRTRVEPRVEAEEAALEQELEAAKRAQRRGQR